MLKALLARFVAFGFGDPIDVFAAFAGAEILEVGRGLFVFAEKREEIVWRCGGRFGFAGLGGEFDFSFVDPDGFFDVADENFLAGQILDGSDFAELAHAFPLFGVRNYQAAFPEMNGAMIFESDHVAEDFFAHEKGRAPFHGFGHIRAAFVNGFADPGEDWASVFGGFCDVGVDSWVACSHNL